MKKNIICAIKSGLILVGLIKFCFAGSSFETTTSATVLLIKPYTFSVNGKKASEYRIIQPNGTWGYIGKKGQLFNVLVKNETSVPTTLHWHGLIVPNNQDGVPYITQQPIPPGGEYHYHFKLLQSGTYWMHSHYGFQIQQLISAPLIILNPANKTNEKNVVMFLTDFSFKSPATILQELKHGKKPYDAYLTNYHTLESPEIIKVVPGELVRLRVIDGSAMTNFFVNTGDLQGTVIAADGTDVHPLKEKRFQIAIGQRLDILVKIPKKQGAYPIVAEGGGTTMQTGLILATAHVKIPHLSEIAKVKAGELNYQQDRRLKALHPFAVRPIQQVLHVNLEGNMKKYQWEINHQRWPNVTPLIVKYGERVEMIFNNHTAMAHPMHLHGHVFEVTAINGKPIKDVVMRDTILVLPHTTVTVQFNATNPGNWVLHCHMLYHEAAGMMTLLSYTGTKIPPLKPM